MTSTTTRAERARCLRLAAASAGLAMVLAASTACADDYVVYSPYVTKGQSEVELRGYQQRDGDPSLGGDRGYEIAVAHAFTDWWRPEVYLGEYERPPGEGQQPLCPVKMPCQKHQPGDQEDQSRQDGKGQSQHPQGHQKHAREDVPRRAQ